MNTWSWQRMVMQVALLLVPFLAFASSASASTLGWEPIEFPPELGPTARYGAAMVYDSARDRVVLFGGALERSYYNDTWEWDGVQWTNVTPAVSPEPRVWHAMAYDSVRQRVVMFGGISTELLSADIWGEDILVYTNYEDTWEWDGSAWTLRDPGPSGGSVAPAARRGHTMAYDSVRQRVVLFGGAYMPTWWPWAIVREARMYNDTWEWDGAAWTLRTSVATPSLRAGHSMAFDSARGVMVMFGGWLMIVTTEGGCADCDPSPTPLSDIGYFHWGDTWEWNGVEWRKVGVGITNPPLEVAGGAAMIYDSSRGRVVMFGGGSGGAGYPAHRPEEGSEVNSCYSVTWEWDGVQWMNRTPELRYAPGVCRNHAMVYDSLRRQTVLFGGAGCRTPDNPNNRGGTAEMWALRPVEGVCDGRDDDGDGQIDEGCDQDGDGYCWAGIPVDGTPAVCPHGGGDCRDNNALVYPGAVEVCNAIDDDCNGMYDDAVTRTTVCGVGACRRTGTETCAWGYWGPDTCIPGQPVAEICNAIDDDCDGLIDNGLGLGTVEVFANPARLWPPNHRMVDVHATVSLAGGCPSACPAPPSVVLISAASSEPDDAAGPGDGQTTNDIQEATLGAVDFDFKLRAERDGSGAGRLYEIGYLATDCFGDTAVGHGGVLVPHDEGGQTEPLALGVSALPGAAGGHALEWNAIAGASSYSAMRVSRSSIRAMGSFTVLENADCIGRDLKTTTVSGALVDESPPPGEEFLYLAEYFKGFHSGFGTESSGREMVIASGDPCR